MLTPEITKKLMDNYKLEIGTLVEVPDGRKGVLMNASFDPDKGVVQFLGKDSTFYKESFELKDLKNVSYL